MQEELTTPQRCGLVAPCMAWGKCVYHQGVSWSTNRQHVPHVMYSRVGVFKFDM